MSDELWTTRRTDGQDLHDEYTMGIGWTVEDADEHATSDAAFSYSDADEPIEYVIERWALVDRRTFILRPSEARAERER